MTRKRAKPRWAPPPNRTVQEGQARRRALKAVSLMRKGKSASQAARQAGTTVPTLRRYARAALRRAEGIYHAVPVDQMRRPMRVATPEGLVVADIRSSRTASRLGTYWNAVDHYLRTGDQSQLRPFRGKRIRSATGALRYLTDPRTLDRLALAGQVSFEEAYAPTA